jgi:riboflavin kinase/FMN adenylyltransferase
LDAKAVVITFEPHPMALLRPAEAPSLLTTLREKLSLVDAAGLDQAVVLGFNRDLAGRTAEWFVRRVLLERLRTARLVIGYDFRFGKGREGDAEYLKRLGEEAGFGVDIVPPVNFAGHPISSTRVRTALARGDVKSAQKMLGRMYSFSGKVIRGEGRGRLLGFPTANLEVCDAGKMLPGFGIYAVRVEVAGALHPGAMYIGTKPTYGGKEISLEVFLIGPASNLYGRKLKVFFVDRVRDERRFKSGEALERAMARDVARVRRLLVN